MKERVKGVQQLEIYKNMKSVQFSLFFFLRILCSQTVHTQGIQLVPELLLLAYDILNTKCRHIEHLHISHIGCSMKLNIGFKHL